MKNGDIVNVLLRARIDATVNNDILVTPLMPDSDEEQGEQFWVDKHYIETIEN